MPLPCKEGREYQTLPLTKADHTGPAAVTGTRRGEERLRQRRLQTIDRRGHQGEATAAPLVRTKRLSNGSTNGRSWGCAMKLKLAAKLSS